MSFLSFELHVLVGITAYSINDDQVLLWLWQTFLDGGYGQNLRTLEDPVRPQTKRSPPPPQEKNE